MCMFRMPKASHVYRKAFDQRNIRPRVARSNHHGFTIHIQTRWVWEKRCERKFYMIYYNDQSLKTVKL